MTDFDSPSPESNPRDAEYLARLQDYYADWKSIPPTLRCARCSASPPSHGSRRSWTGWQGGFIERTPDGVWVPTRQFFARPLAESSVQAGMPVSVTATSGDYLVIDEMLIDNPSTTTLIPVKGDSMIDAGIHDGDVAVVEKRLTANLGDIVVAIVDNEFTLKTLDKERGHFVLRRPIPPIL